MALDLDDKDFIASDLANLSQYETRELTEGRIDENVLALFTGRALGVAAQYRAGALRRLDVIRQLGLLGKGRGASAYITIQECIQKLDASIEQQGAAADG